VLLTGLLGAVGCGGSTGPAIYPVTGVVLRDGSPLADVSVEFVPDKGRPSAATTDKDGKFVLEYLEGSRGALKGNHKVRVVERFRGASPESPVPVDQFNPPPEPKSYDLPSPAQVHAKSNSFVIDVTAGTTVAGS
jgi:hypothetical protein